MMAYGYWKIFFLILIDEIFAVSIRKNAR